MVNVRIPSAAPSQRVRTKNARPTNYRNGILWILRTGAPWRDLPKHYGHWYSIYARFRLWQLDGTWEKVLTELLNRYGIEGKIDWSLFSVDGTIVKAHKGCASKSNREGLRCRHITPVLPYKSNEKGALRPFDSGTYVHRNTIERVFDHLKECRRVATRYDKLAVRDHAFVNIAIIRYLLAT